MGSIVRTERSNKRAKKLEVVFRAHAQRTGFAKKSKVCKTEREAKEWLRLNDNDSALSRATARDTFESLVETFVEAPATPGTKFWSAGHLNFWISQLGGRRVAEITRGDINAGKAKLQTRPAMRSTPSGPQETDRKLTNATINRYMASLSSVLNFALEREIIDAHPMKGGKVRKLKESEGRRRILSAAEEAALMTAAQASSWPLLPLFVRTCLTTAARRSEVLNLRWQDVRLDDSIAVLAKTKNGKARALPLVSDVRVALAEAAKVRPLHSDYVFFNPRKPTQPMNVDTVWKACRKAAGLLNDRDDPLDRVYLHSTRHTAVTRLLKGGANLAQAAAVSGHQTLAMLKRYEHLAASDAVDLAEKHLSGKTQE